MLSTVFLCCFFFLYFSPGSFGGFSGSPLAGVPGRTRQRQALPRAGAGARRPWPLCAGRRGRGRLAACAALTAMYYKFNGFTQRLVGAAASAAYNPQVTQPPPQVSSQP